MAGQIQSIERAFQIKGLLMTGYSQEKHQMFSKKLIDILNQGALNLAMGIGYRLGLFDAMDEFEIPVSSSAIAEKTALNERYITEWLSVMVCGGIVELVKNKQGESFFNLPKEHADLITKRSGASNLGVYTQEIPLLTISVMKNVLEGFKTGNGVEYEKYSEFQRFMTQLANAKHSQVLVQTFLPSLKNGLLVKKLKSGIRICDLGCGEGVALMLMAEAFPKSQFVGIDISAEAIQTAKRTAQEKSIANASFLQLDAASLADYPEWKNTFDYVMAFDAIHDQTRPLEALKGSYAILKPGGDFSMVDIAANSDLAENVIHPMGAFLYTVSLMHCMPVGLVNGGPGLGMMWGHQKAVKMLEEAGFQNVEVLKIPHDSFNLHFFAKKPDKA